MRKSISKFISAVTPEEEAERRQQWLRENTPSEQEVEDARSDTECHTTYRGQP